MSVELSRSLNHILAEISVTPIGSGCTSVGHQVGAALRAIKRVKGIKLEINAMGTVLQADSLEKIFEAVRVANDAMRSLGEKRVQTILKIDNRTDKPATMQSKIVSAKRNLARQC